MTRLAAAVAGSVQLAQAGPAGGGSSGGGGGGGEGGGDGAAGEGESSGGARAPGSAREDGPVTRTVREINEVVPDALMAALAVLAGLSLLLGIGYLVAAQRARRLAKRRRELLDEVGLLQTALLPPVPERVGAVRASVAYRPSDGPGAGGDFYDALTLPGGRAAFILGDVSRPRPRGAGPHGLHALHAARLPRRRPRAAAGPAGGRARRGRPARRRLRHGRDRRARPRRRHAHLRERRAPGADRGRRRSCTSRSWPASSPPIGWGLRTGLRQTRAPARRAGRRGLPLHRRAGRGHHRATASSAARASRRSWPRCGPRRHRGR